MAKDVLDKVKEKVEHFNVTVRTGNMKGRALVASVLTKEELGGVAKEEFH